jgi:hypothetical protein
MKTLENIKNALSENPNFEIYTNEDDNGKYNDGAMKLVPMGYYGAMGCAINYTDYGDKVIWESGYNFEDLCKTILKSDRILIRKKLSSK